MNTSSDDKRAIPSKLDNNNEDDEKLSKALARAASSSTTTTTTTTTSRQWAGFKNPRIVRVSRTFGGKDRHSKVCTIRGLRDRRIRLSVPTAVQLYDLQDRLGLSQPSKVVDWLLDAAKLDIDKLPPLQIPPGTFADFHHQSLFPQFPNSTPIPQFPNPAPDNGININDDVDVDEDEDDDEKSTQVSVSAQSFYPGLGLPYGGNNMYNWDPSNLSLSQFGSSSQSEEQHQHQHQHQHHLGNNSYSSNAASTPHQLFFCPPLFPQQDNRFHLSGNPLSHFHSTGSGMRDFDPQSNDDKGHDS